jgi:hypothetical protein
MDAEQWFTSREAANFLKISTARLRELMRKGHLVEGQHFTRPSGMHPRFRLSGLIRYLNPRNCRKIRWLLKVMENTKVSKYGRFVLHTSV